MEAVMPVLVEVQRERDRPNQFLLHLPRIIARQPGDAGILFEPIVQGLFARGESSSASAAHTPQIDAQETAERQPQRGPLGVAAKMVEDSGAESLAARRPR
jgi:hypothetical protein